MNVADLLKNRRESAPKCEHCGRPLTDNAGRLECMSESCPENIRLRKEIQEEEKKISSAPRCTNCQNEISEMYQREFCSATCFVAWMNQLRLLFPTEKPEDIDLAKIYANQAILRLVKDRTIEENMAICEILTSAVVQLTLTILPQKAKKEIEDRLENTKKRAALVKESVVQKNSKQVQDAEKTRIKQELAKVGIKEAPDGKCKYCGVASPWDFCSDLHKQNFKSAEKFQRSMKLDLATAIKMVQEIEEKGSAQ